MSAGWTVIVLLAFATLALKGFGTVTLGHRPPSERTAGVAGLLAPALLAGLVVYETLGTHGPGIEFDARLAGLAAAVAGLVLRLPLLAVIALAALAAALARLLT